MRRLAIGVVLLSSAIGGCWPAYDPPSTPVAGTDTPSPSPAPSPTVTFRPDLSFDTLFIGASPEGLTIDDPLNWSHGLPSIGDGTPPLDGDPSPSPDILRPRRGGVGSTFRASADLEESPMPLDGMDLTLFEEGSLELGGALSISSAHLMLLDRSRFDNGGSASYPTVLQAQGEGETLLTISDGAQAFFGDLILGQGGPARVYQDGGRVTIASILEVGDEPQGSESVYQLAGGLVRISDLEAVTGLGYGTFDFALGSTGRLQIRSENKAVEQLYQMVDEGGITLNSWLMPRGDFDIRGLTIDGEAYSEVTLAKRGLVAHYPFEDDARDVSGNQNDPRTVTGVTRILSDSERGHVFRFDSDSEIQLPNMQDQFEGEGTFMLWVKADDILSRLIARYDFREDETLQVDQAGGNDAVSIGSPGWSAEGGEHIGVLTLDGASVLEVGPEVLTEAAEEYGEGLFSAWVYLDSLDPDAQYIFGCEEDNSRLYFLRVLKGGTLEASLGAPGAVLRSDQRLKSQVWQHVAYRWRHGNVVEIYINGERASDSTSGQFGTPWEADKGRIYLGGTFQGTEIGGFLQGRMDDVRIYSNDFDSNAPANLIRPHSPFIVGDPLGDGTPRTLFPKGAASFLFSGLTKERRVYGLSVEGVRATGFEKSAWSHHTFVTEPGEAGSQTFRHYINGVELVPELVVGEMPTEADASFFIRTTPRLGSGEAGSDNPQLYDGWMDDVRFYNRALSVEEIQLFVPHAQSEANRR